MPQFSVYKNKNAATKARVPYLLDVQSNLLSELETRVVVPLNLATAMKGNALTVLRIPRSSGHPFHEHLTTDSTVIRPPIPRVSDH